MNGILLGKFDRTSLVGGLADNIENTPKDPFTDGNGNWFRRVDDFHPPLKPSVELIAMARTQFSPRCC